MLGEQGHCHCKSPQNPSHPITNISYDLDHGSPRDQLAEGHPSHELPFFHPSVSIYCCLLDLSDHCGAAVSRGPKFKTLINKRLSGVMSSP